MTRSSKAKRKAIKKREFRRNVIHLNWAVNHFDEPLDYDHDGGYTGTYWKGSPVNDKKGEPMHFYTLRLKYIPHILNRLRYSGTLSDEERDSLANMCLSDDRDNWYMAFVIVKNYINTKKNK